MSAPLVPVLTTAGLAEVVNAQGTGVQATIQQIAIGRGQLIGGVYKGYAPTSAATALMGPMATVPILTGSRLDPHGFRVMGVLPASSPGEYPINEIAFKLSSGTLLAIWSDPLYPLAYKTALADVELAFDLLLEALPVSALTIEVMQPDIPDTTAVLARLLEGLARTTTETIRIHERLKARGIQGPTP